MARGPILPIMPAKAGIHALAARTKASRGWPAFAGHDLLGRALRYSTQLFLGVALDVRRLLGDDFVARV